MDVEGSAANAAGVTSQGYLIRYRAACQEGERGDAQKPASPCMPSASDSRCGRGRACRRTRAGVSSPRPRPQAVVASRTPRPRGRGAGGSWEKTATRSAPTTAWGQQKAGAVRPPRRTCPPLGGRAAGCPHAAEEPRQTRGEAPHCPWATGAGGRVCRAPPLVGGDGDGRRAHGSRALCARPYASRAGLWPAAPHTLDVPQPPLAARDNERRAHGPCAHASDANRRTQCRAA